LIDRLAKTPYPPLQALDEIKQIDLGDRVITWRLVPGHTQGSVAFLDEKYHTVFDGDCSGNGVWIYLPESSPLEVYLSELEKYLSFLHQNNVQQRYVGHSKNALKTKQVQQLINCGKAAASNEKKGIKFHAMMGDARIVFSGGTMMFCKR
jgi:hypothetical protein